MILPKLHINSQWFKDEYGRTVMLRGVNLGASGKVPLVPNECTNIPTDFSKHREVSFIGRPFPLEDLDEHFSRLRHWGFNILRFLITWEAIEHKGPGEYDIDYLNYFTEICKKAEDYGLYIFIDFHQDVWSRMTGGDGAPCWLFEKVGIDYTKLSETNWAHIMQHTFDFADPRPRQEDNFPTMSWTYNRKYPANGLMWLLFFGGRDFTPNFKIDGLNVQDYMFKHFIGSVKKIAERVRNMSHVIGFDTLNEPCSGWIGIALDDRHLISTKENPVLPGLAWSPIDGLYVSHGYSLEIPNMELSLIKAGFVPKRMIRVNPNKHSLWFDNKTDPFMEEEIWQLNENGTYEILKNDAFQVVKGKRINFNEDFMFPFMNRVAENLYQIREDWLIFGEMEAKDVIFNPDMSIPPKVPKNFVNATHWYDFAVQGKQRSFYPISVDVATQKFLIGKKNLYKMYLRQMRAIKNASMKIYNNCPTLIGEMGIPYNMGNGKAYKKWAKGKRGKAVWKRHIMMLDLMYNAMDQLFISSAQWCYNAYNRNDLRIGDCWNQSDCSIFCIDQIDNPNDINSGGRAMSGWLRPFAPFIQGVPHKMEFNLKSGDFTLIFRADPSINAPTVIYVPRFQYSNGYNTIYHKCEIEEKISDQLIEIKSNKEQVVEYMIRRKKNV
ncbi:MAG: cellulase family glycosylhydrolase [Promethearchaeota archaeon]